MKKTRFFFHYNKPLSKSTGVDHLSVHFRDSCHFVQGLVCNVPTESHKRKTQPRVVIRGWASSITIKDNIATIS